MPIRRLFVKVFLWFWLTVLALPAIFFASRTLGSRLLPAPDVIAASLPRERMRRNTRMNLEVHKGLRNSNEN